MVPYPACLLTFWAFMSETVTASEVYRHLTRMGEQIDRIESSVVPRKEFEAHKEHETIVRNDLRVVHEREHSRLNARIDDVVDSQTSTQYEQSRQRREFNGKMVAAVLGSVISLVGAFVIQFVG